MIAAGHNLGNVHLFASLVIVCFCLLPGGQHNLPELVATWNNAESKKFLCLIVEGDESV